MQHQHQAPADDRSNSRAAEICELALVALVTELHVSSADAAAILLAEASKHMTPGAVTDALRRAI